MDQTMKLLARILFMCTLQCKTGTCLATVQTMKLLGRVPFMCTLRCKTGLKLKEIYKESFLFLVSEYIRCNIYQQRILHRGLQLILWASCNVLIHLTMFVSLQQVFSFECISFLYNTENSYINKTTKPVHMYCKRAS